MEQKLTSWALLGLGSFLVLLLVTPALRMLVRLLVKGPLRQVERDLRNLRSLLERVQQSRALEGHAFPPLGPDSCKEDGSYRTVNEDFDRVQKSAIASYRRARDLVVETKRFLKAPPKKSLNVAFLFLTLVKALKVRKARRLIDAGFEQVKKAQKFGAPPSTRA